MTECPTNRRGAPGHHDVRCSHHLRATCPPRKPMACDTARQAFHKDQIAACLHAQVCQGKRLRRQAQGTMGAWSGIAEAAHSPATPVRAGGATRDRQSSGHTQLGTWRTTMAMRGDNRASSYPVGQGEALTQLEDEEVRASRAPPQGAASTGRQEYKGYKIMLQ